MRRPARASVLPSRGTAASSSCEAARCKTLEGDWKTKRMVVTEFPNIEQARRWYDSEEYRALKALRLRTARGSVVLVEGV